jgi:hypothetical protein
MSLGVKWDTITETEREMFWTLVFQCGYSPHFADAYLRLLRRSDLRGGSDPEDARASRRPEGTP